jgi:hypothetical protein
MFALPRILVFAPIVGAMAQAPTPRTPRVEPVAREIGAVVARTNAPIAAVTALRVLSTGQVLVHDATRRQVLFFEPGLDHWRPIADSAATTGRLYGTGLANMTAFAGDSTLIQDVATNAFLVLDPYGTLARLIPAPRAATAPQPAAGPLIGYDQAGYLLFRGGQPRQLPYIYSLNTDTSVLRSTTIAVRRVALDGWRSDTVARLQIPRIRDSLARAEFGFGLRTATSPIATNDDAALTADGTLVLVRARDYRIDWLPPNGKLIVGPKIDAALTPLSESAKVAFMDSLRRADSTADARRIAESIARGNEPPFIPPRNYVDPSDLPDHLPPFLAGFARVDARGRVWVMMSRPVGGPPAQLYDIIDRVGTCVDRVQLPVNAVLVGLGADVVYYTMPAAGGVQLVMARMR